VGDAAGNVHVYNVDDAADDLRWREQGYARPSAWRVAGELVLGSVSEVGCMSDSPAVSAATDLLEEEWIDSLDALVAAPDHHTLLYENDRVRVLDTCIRPGDQTPIHTHHRPAVIYALSWSHFVRYDSQGAALLPGPRHLLKQNEKCRSVLPTECLRARPTGKLSSPVRHPEQQQVIPCLSPRGEGLRDNSAVQPRMASLRMQIQMHDELGWDMIPPQVHCPDLGHRPPGSGQRMRQRGCHRVSAAPVRMRSDRARCPR
jgi:hypothetical protein